MVDETLKNKCIQASKAIRRDIIEMTYASGNVGAHLGGSLSMVEMLAVCYLGIAKYDINDWEWEQRDRVILSKGHAALVLYAVFAQAGIIPKEILSEFKKNGSILSGHPSLNGLAGIEYASGSLGQGLSLAVGVSLALKRKGNNKSRVFVFMGDGECNEGSVWEAAASAAHFNLNTITAIIDCNNIQYDGNTNDIMNMSPMVQKWRDFGWDPVEVDGHNVEELIEAYKRESNKPTVIIAHTVKGKGVSFMEGNWRYHNSRLSQNQYNEAIAELESDI